jgi:hypothetical protein
MPGRNGTGPLGQGPRTGRGMGKCTSTQINITQPSITGINKSLGWGNRIWDCSIGRLFGRRRNSRFNQK